MQKTLLIIGIVSIIGMVLMFHAAAQSSSLEMSGNLYDAEGKRLYPTEGDNYWIGADGSIFSIDPTNVNHLVAFSSDGRELGTGQLTGIDYELRLRNFWQEPVIHVYAGYYDPVRPERTQLLYCTSFETSKLPYVRKVLVDMWCENITLEEGTTGAYR